MVNDYPSVAGAPTLPEPQIIEHTLVQATAQHQAGLLEEAARAYLSVLQARPDHPEANYHLGKLAVETGHCSAALTYFSAALDADPTRGPFWIGYIDALFQAGQPENARQILELARRQGLCGEEVEALAARLNDPVQPNAQPPRPVEQANTRHARHTARKPASLGGKPGRKSQPATPHAGLQQDMDSVASLVSEGRFEEAASLARTLTVRFPQLGFGWKALGTALNLLGRNEEALPPLRKAVTLMSDDAELHNNLGNVFLALGQLDEAEACYRAALEIRPDYAQAHCNLGATLNQAGRLEEAEAHYRRALQINPGYIKACCNLASLLQTLCRTDEAEACLQRMLQAHPAQVDVLYNLAVLLHASARFTEAEVLLRQALDISPDHARTLHRLGVTLVVLGRHAEAEPCFRRALEREPEFAEAYCALGNMLADLGRSQEAVLNLRYALRFTTDPATIHSNLANILATMGRIEEAELDCQCALALQPDHAGAHGALANTLTIRGRLDEAEASFRRSLELRPNATLRGNLLFTLNYLSRSSPEAGVAEARRYGREVADSAAPFTEWSCAKQPQRLRVGLVSGDFRNHPVGYFLESLLAQLDPSSIELFAYPTSPQSDPLTERIKPYFSAWKPLTGLNDSAAAHLIHGDALHVLIDLSGHTAKNRLPVFAWKPAPVQASWLGYFATTGVPGMDYLLGDPYVTPTSEASHFTERIWQLPESYLCFSEPDAALEVTPLPALSNGHITFASFNNLTKMNDAVVRVWANVLKAVPTSRLFLKSFQLSDPAVRQTTAERFSEHGILPDRLILEGKSPRTELLASYQRVDVALDPFPYPGGTTSIEGLWMGVPVITRRGDRFLSHVGETIAHNAGLSEWIAADDHDYVEKAVACASGLDRLANLRAGLRQQVLGSPLFDAARFAQQFNEAIWGMWKQWLNQQNAA